MTLDELVDQLKKVYGAKLNAVVLYGSAAAGEHIPKRSDYNVLVVVDELTMQHMRAGAAVARAWGEDGNPPPLTLTIRSSKRSQSLLTAKVVRRHTSVAIKPHPSPLGHSSPQAVLGINPQMQHQRPERSRDTLKVARESQQRSFIRTRPREHPRQIDPRPILNPHA